MDQSEMHDKGVALLEKLYGEGTLEAMKAEMADICPFFVDMTTDWALGGIMSRPGLDPLTRELLMIASCVTLGHAMPQLRAHATGALSLGATKEQIVETVLQMTFYAGGAAVRNSLVELKPILNG